MPSKPGTNPPSQKDDRQELQSVEKSKTVGQANETAQAVKKVFTNPLEGFISLATKAFKAGKSVYNKSEEYRFFLPLYILVKIIQVALVIVAVVAFIAIYFALIPSAMIAQGLMSLSRGLGNLITAGAYTEHTKRAQEKFVQELDSMVQKPERIEHAKRVWLKEIIGAIEACTKSEKNAQELEIEASYKIILEVARLQPNILQKYIQLTSELNRQLYRYNGMKGEEFTHAFEITLSEQSSTASDPKKVELLVEALIAQVNKALCAIELSTKQPNKVVTSLKILYNSLTRPLPGGAKNIYAIPLRFVQGLLSVGVVLPVMIVSEVATAAQGIAILGFLGAPSLAFITTFVALNIPLYIKDGIKGLWNLCCCRKGPRVVPEASEQNFDGLSGVTLPVSPGLAKLGASSPKKTAPKSSEAATPPAHHQCPAATGRTNVPAGTGKDQGFPEQRSCIPGQSS